MTDEPSHQPPEPSPSPASCAIHPNLPALASCTRCDKRLCASCSDGRSRPTCLDCRALAHRSGPFPYSRDDWSLDGLISVAWARYKQHWLLLSLVVGGGMALFYLLSFGLRAALGMPSAKTLADPLHFAARGAALQALMTALQLVHQLITLGLCLDVLEGRPVSFGAAVARVRRFPTALLQMLSMFAVMALAATPLFAVVAQTMFAARHPSRWFAGLGFLISGALFLYGMLGFAFAQLHLVAEPQSGALGAMMSSWNIVAGRRLALVGVGLVATLMALAGVLACGVGLLVSLPLSFLVFCSLFLALKTPTP
jgi:hypothetical protein